MPPRLRLALLAALAVVTVATLGLVRPHPAGPPLGWSGTDVAVVAAWAVAVATAVWLAVIALVCLAALRTRRSNLARAAAARGPRMVRRCVELALVGSVAMGTAAGATTPTTHSGAPVIDQPVVRAPQAASRPSPPTVPAPDTRTSVPTTAPTPSTARPVPAPDQPVVRTPVVAAPNRPATPPRRSEPMPAPAPTPAPPKPAGPDRTHVVVRGDNLWLIARAELVARGNPRPDDATIARYWQRVIDTNRTTLRSGSPSLIYPGEIVALPEPV